MANLASELAPDPVRIVLTTVSTEADARRIARALVEARLAACVNLVPLAASVYRWEGRIEEEAEVLLVVKTSQEREAELRARLDELHPYDVPEVLVLEAWAAAAYREWVEECVGRGPR